MLTLWGRRKTFCDGLTRRGFLKIGAFGSSLTLAKMLEGRAVAQNRQATSPKAAIMIWLPGGPSHLDTYDLKPEAPVEIRGEFRPIATNVPGMRICEHLPRQARLCDKLALIRSVGPVAGDHSDAEIMTGFSEAPAVRAPRPSFGAVVSKLREGANADIPPFVSLRGPTIGTEPGFLGVSHRPFTSDGPGQQNLRLAGGVSADRVQDRRRLLAHFDGIRRDIDAKGTMTGLDAFTVRAFDMVTSGRVRHALDLTRANPRDLDRYHGAEQLNFLTARRLIEAGVGCVTLAIGGWDTHTSNFRALREMLPRVDRAISNLIQDLHDRGMDEDVVTVIWGEFGRTPRINAEGGRDHWPSVMSAVVAGGGLKMGQVIGATNANGEVSRDRPYTISRVLSTLYRAIGIDPAGTFPDQAGRPIHILDDREPVSELL